MSMELHSTAFGDGKLIPERYTWEGKNISPPLFWNHAPSRSRSFVLVCYSSDSFDSAWGTRVHWLLYGIPGKSRELPESVISEAILADDSRHGWNTWGRFGYEGPSEIAENRVCFKLYALEEELDLEPGMTYDRVIISIEGHIIDEAELRGGCAGIDVMVAV